MEAYVYEIARRVRETLGPRFGGVWLLGSLALDDFDPRRSDIDIQAISTELVPLVERWELVSRLEHDALPCPARGLEFVLYARADLRDAGGPRPSLNLNTGAHMEHHAAYDAEDPRFWFTIDVSMARQRGVPLIGPPAAEAFPALSTPLLLRALHEALEWYASEGGAPEQTLLGACRTWAWATDGQWRSKGESARWVMARLADPAPVERALARRDGRDVPPPTDAEVGAVVAAARAALAADPVRA